MTSRSSNLRRARPLLGTIVEVSVHGTPSSLAHALEAAFAAVAAVHRLMSFHDAASDVSRLNRDALHAPVRVDPRTWSVLAAARRVSAASSGLFDVTVAAPPRGPGGGAAARFASKLARHRARCE